MNLSACASKKNLRPVLRGCACKKNLRPEDHTRYQVAKRRETTDEQCMSCPKVCSHVLVGVATQASLCMVRRPHDLLAQSSSFHDSSPALHRKAKPIRSFLRRGTMPPSACREAPIEPCDASHILFAVMASRDRQELVNTRFGRVCISSGARCLVYFDRDGSNQSQLGYIAVEPSAYLATNPTHPEARDCCARTPQSGGDLSQSGSFFCDKHVSTTLSAQYRFLPALDHARRVHHAAFQSGILKWLVLVDDDSVVNIQQLTTVLARCPSAKSLYLGDFGMFTYLSPRIPDTSRGDLYASRRGAVSATHSGWDRSPPFACGGSGTIFSRAALLSMDVAACVRRYHSRCLQSDWMLGRCAYDHGVSAEQSMSCGVCGVMTQCLPQMQRKITDRAAQLERQSAHLCAFAQWTQWCSSINRRKFVRNRTYQAGVLDYRRALCLRGGPAGLAISHGATNKLCERAMQT